jgi:hypothetical protein
MLVASCGCDIFCLSFVITFVTTVVVVVVVVVVLVVDVTALLGFVAQSEGEVEDRVSVVAICWDLFIRFCSSFLCNDSISDIVV